MNPSNTPQSSLLLRSEGGPGFRDLIKAHRGPPVRDATPEISGSDISLRNTQLEEAASSLKVRLEEVIHQIRSPQGHHTTPTPGGPESNVTSLLQRERAANEERNARALFLLRSKDDALQASETRCIQIEEENAKLRAEALASGRRLDEAYARVKELAAANRSHRQQAEDAEARHQEAMAIAKKDLEYAHEMENKRVCAAEDETMQMRAALEASEQQVGTLTAALQAADEIMNDMQSALRQRSSVEAKAKSDIAVLEGYVANLLGIARSEASTIAGITDVDDGIDLSQGAPQKQAEEAQEDSLNVHKIRAANDALQRALIRANLRLAGVNPSMHSTLDSLMAAMAPQGISGLPAVPSPALHTNGEEFEIDAEIARLAGEVVAANERTAHLEMTQSIAQRAALHAEAELQAALEREICLKEQQDLTVAKLERLERAMTDSVAALAQLREEKQEESSRLSLEVEDLKAQVATSEGRVVELQNQCKKLEGELGTLHGDLEIATNEAEDAKAAAKDSKEASSERVAAALRQSGAFKEQLLSAQDENDTLKMCIERLEKAAAVQSLQETAHQAAAAFVARVSDDVHPQRNSPASPPLPSEELAARLREAIESQIEMHNELSVCQRVIKANERAMASMHSSIHRLRAALGEEGPSRVEEIDEPEDRHAELAYNRLQERLRRSLAAQEGQAAAFAAVVAESQKREATLLAQLDEVEGAEMARLHADALCTAAVGAMHGALAHVALAEGDTDAAEGLLQAELDPAALADVTAAIAAKVEEYAQWIVRQQQGTDPSESARLAAAQREVIKNLSCQIKNSDKLDQNGDHLRNGVNEGKRSDACHLIRLCSLLSSQLECARAAMSVAQEEDLLKSQNDLLGVVESMRGTLLVLHSDLQRELDHEGGPQRNATGGSPSSHSGCLHLTSGPTAEAQHHEDSNDGDQMIAMAEHLTKLTARIATLTAANEAAQEEAAHAHESVALLTEELERVQSRTEELQRVQCRKTYAAESDSDDETVLREQLAKAHAECRQLLSVVEKLYAERRDWEGCSGMTARGVAALKSQLEKGDMNEMTHKNDTVNPRQPPEALVALLDGMDGLLRDAAAMEERLMMLESQATEAAGLRSALAEKRWNGLTAAKAHACGAAAAWNEARSEVIEAQKRCVQHAQHAGALADRVRELERECAELQNRLATAHSLHEEEFHHVAELHAAQLAAMEAEMRAQREELGRRADAAVSTAVEETSMRTRAEVGRGLQDTLRALEDSERECVRLRAERDAAHAEFCKFRGIKAAEVALLEQRLGIEPASSTGPETTSPDDCNAGELRVAAASGEIAAACRVDAVTAAMREAKIERKHRNQLQKSLEAARGAEKKAQAASKAAEKEVAILKKRLREASVTAEQSIRELSGQLAAAKSEIAASAAECASRAAEVEKLKGQLISAVGDVAESERRQREALEREIQDAVVTLTAPSALMSDVALRVDRAGREVELLRNDLDDLCAFDRGRE